MAHTFRPLAGSLAIILALTCFEDETAAQDRTEPRSSEVISTSTSAIKSNQLREAKSPGSSNDPAPYVDPATLVPDLPAVPSAKLTLVGGTIQRLDRVRDRVILSVFGGGRITVLFDPRTAVYLGGNSASIADLREGQRAYLETMLDGNSVFARTIRLNPAPRLGEMQGTLIGFKADHGELIIRDALSPAGVHVILSPSTIYSEGGRTVSSNTLVPGSLIRVSFEADGKDRSTARHITILALPGSRFTFSGVVQHIDLRLGLLVLNSTVDRKIYEIYLSDAIPRENDLRAGSDVTVLASFRDSKYVAQTITIQSTSK